MSDNKFVPGLYVKAPRAGAPDFVKGAISIKPKELAAWLAGQEGEWVNLDIKESKEGKWYAAINTWKREDKPKDEPKPQNDFVDDPLPF